MVFMEKNGIYGSNFFNIFLVLCNQDGIFRGKFLNDENKFCSMTSQKKLLYFLKASTPKSTFHRATWLVCRSRPNCEKVR